MRTNHCTSWPTAISCIIGSQVAVAMLAMVLTIGLIVPSRAFEVHTGDDDHADTTPLPKDPFRNHIHTMSTNGDYWKLQTAGALVKQTHQKDVPVEVPIVQLADILPSTGFVVVKDMMTGRVLANSTGFFVAPNVVLTAAHLVAPLIRRFHVQLDVISNSRSIASINTYNVIGLSYDFASTPCQILLQINRNHTHYLPLSKEPAEDGSMVRVISNSPIGFGGIHLDGIVSRVFDVWKEGIEQQCFREQSIAKYNWYCDQERFLISTPTWAGASGSPVISATGVIGTVETDGPHPGTAVAASTHGIVIPPDVNFAPIESIHPALLGDGEADVTVQHHPWSLIGFIKLLWSRGLRWMLVGDS